MSKKEMTPEEKAELDERLAALDDHECVTLNEDGTRTLALNRPIDLPKQGQLNVLTFRDEITAGDLEDSEKSEGDIGQANRLIAAVTGTAYTNIRKLRSDDLELAGLVIAKISGKDPSDGGTS
jgi:hypothetical protein